ncbi:MULTISPECIES: hypothetical protein [unclassified Streptomyces]|uniref:hypothetical protein n=1 Tax=unclassified Streptomyces TaxID=2593676 RepID=UPI002DDBBB16|nr:hypothetical protein [Streptomyces sp. NBC_01750]WSB05030.1 hypothetical protein OIE54_41020 [Streptomyces sp. NBC_01794]WSD30698.1 hypothetical protein OG966_01100 [Streptomyces sp. NBC_01750]
MTRHTAATATPAATYELGFQRHSGTISWPKKRWGRSRPPRPLLPVQAEVGEPGLAQAPQVRLQAVEAVGEHDLVEVLRGQARVGVDHRLVLGADRVFGHRPVGRAAVAGRSYAARLRSVESVDELTVGGPCGLKFLVSFFELAYVRRVCARQRPEGAA